MYCSKICVIILFWFSSGYALDPSVATASISEERFAFFLLSSFSASVGVLFSLSTFCVSCLQSLLVIFIPLKQQLILKSKF